MQLQDTEALRRARLFDGLSSEEVGAALGCLDARLSTYAQGQVVLREGAAARLGIVIEGEVEAQLLDSDGNTNFIAAMQPSQTIALAAVFSAAAVMPFDVVCAADSKIIWLDRNRLTAPCHQACGFHHRIIENALRDIADNNIRLAAKIDILSRRTLRDKVLAYLNAAAKHCKRRSFAVPLSRRQMAEYLSVDRSALSRELGRLQNEGIITYSSNHFELLSK